jgi:hypothetical protein
MFIVSGKYRRMIHTRLVHYSWLLVEENQIRIMHFARTCRGFAAEGG